MSFSYLVDPGCEPLLEVIQLGLLVSVAVLPQC